MNVIQSLGSVSPDDGSLLSNVSETLPTHVGSQCTHFLAFEMVSFYTLNIVLIDIHSYKKSEHNLVKTQYFIIIQC